MNNTNPKVDWYFQKSPWPAEMEKLRAIILGCDLTEELKWGKPCYTFGERNVVILQGFKATCALLFAKGVLLKDPHQLLEKPGESTQGARRILFTDVRQILEREAELKEYIREAIEVERAGVEVEFKKNPETVPAELQQKLDSDPDFKTAFHGLTPGRQRGYILHFLAAKQPKTREARVEKCAPLILRGEGLNDRAIASKRSLS